MKKHIQNKLIKLMAKHQNDKKKLNSGQLREAVNIFIKALKELSAEEKLDLLMTKGK